MSSDSSAVVRRWFASSYPSAKLSEEWLQGCLGYLQVKKKPSLLPTKRVLSDFFIIKEHFPGPVRQLIKQTEEQLLFSDLAHSLSSGALPVDIGSSDESKIPGRVLVQVLSITDISHSALQLSDIHKRRKEHAASLLAVVGGATQASGSFSSSRPPPPQSTAATTTTLDGEGGEADMPLNFPRGMLSLQLSDGFTTVKAIEYRTIPQLSLETTQLGCKVNF
jgi:RecQ-mediated genome instability protein 1